MTTTGLDVLVVCLITGCSTAPINIVWTYNRVFAVKDIDYDGELINENMVGAKRRLLWDNGIIHSASPVGKQHFKRLFDIKSKESHVTKTQKTNDSKRLKFHQFLNRVIRNLNTGSIRIDEPAIQREHRLSKRWNVNDLHDADQNWGVGFSKPTPTSVKPRDYDYDEVDLTGDDEVEDEGWFTFEVMLLVIILAVIITCVLFFWWCRILICPWTSGAMDKRMDRNLKITNALAPGITITDDETGKYKKKIGYHQFTEEEREALGDMKAAGYRIAGYG